ncbi:uncharacterized protein A1O9_08202 [Exophiala aquamarina CBS 119918]|uniref:alpha-1,2-Mannosidase n=1 Tax=Exophiala aquamarina CBS 119918 TaxID=1182545 RepID=A0A072P6U5_9EURO|nr:uncharacterized protein A1O9_08202 [Exophiala aquamarina CBS 119918]KEF55452.1 hypothetical protein A1O9_08202 [Exophiala aquamarina CBS 119918]
MAFRRARVAVVLIVILILLLLWHLPKSGERNSPRPIGDIVAIPHEDNYDLHNPIIDFTPLPEASRKGLPRIQHEFGPETPAAKQIRLARLEEIKSATLHSWNGYRRFAWLKDELAPISGSSKTSFGGWAVTLIDSLDTLWLMGLKAEFEEAVSALLGIDFEKPAQLPINVFETTIRYLGGLLGAYDVSNGEYPVLLQKATELGNMLYVAFDTPSHMPVVRWSKIGMEAPAGDTLVAELGSLTLEFTRLTQLTGDVKFYDAVQRISDCFESQQGQTRVPGLFPNVVNARECWFGDGVTFSIGGSADSVYEYFPKEHQLLRGGSAQYQKLYLTAREPLKRHLLFKPSTPTGQGLLLAGTYKKYPTGREEFIPETQHLACFAGGMFALGAKLFDIPDDLNTARSLLDGCAWAYNATVTGIMPEMFRLIPCPDRQQQCSWDEQAWMKEVLEQNSQEESAADKQSLSEEKRAQRLAERLRLPKGMPEMENRGYALRPEVVESIFVLYRITGDESLREVAWSMFESITKYTKTEFGFSSIDDVTRTEPGKIDTMESFWIAETLKYFYLLFEDPSVVSLDDFVFNTEAHPFKVPRG